MSVEHHEVKRLLKSCACSQAQLESDEFQMWMERIKRSKLVMHRKLWEWAFISQALWERGVLKPGKRGLVFAVGQEPLPALFASLGCEVVATDLSTQEASEKGWVETNQHAAELKELNKANICPEEIFEQRVSFRFVDMNQIDDDLRGFDFIWSSCSLEHLGSLEHGKQFIYNAMKCLKPGGIAVHTTEYNVSSNQETIEDGPAVIYRKKDISEIARALRAEGHKIELDFTLGNKPFDLQVDLPPYKHDVHLRLELGGYTSTSYGLIIQKRGLTNSYRESLLRLMYKLSSIPVRGSKRMLRGALEFSRAQPQIKKLARVPFTYFPRLSTRLKNKIYAFAGIRETVSQTQPNNPDGKQSTLMSPFFHYNATFDPQILIKKYALPSVKPHEKYATNFLGLRIDPKIFPSHLTKEVGKVEDIPIPANWHADISEWGAAFRAVEFAESTYTMIEVGCGWGCWMNNTGLVAKRRGLDLNLIGIEGDQGHIDFARETLKRNGFKASQYKIYKGIAAATSGYAFFPKTENSAGAYGQQPVFYDLQQEIEDARKSGKYDELPMVSFEDISKGYSRIDLLHMDIQGGEVDFIHSCLDLLVQKVAYILIGTHSREIEGRLFEILLKSGWLLELERPAILSLDPVPQVTVDGVQAWRNLALLPK